MKTVVIDIETDSVDATRIWVIVTRDVNSSTHQVWLEPFDDFKEYSKSVDLWIAHNGISFDIPVINRLLDMSLDLQKVIDTFVVSRTVAYSLFTTHGLDEIGSPLGAKKKPFSDFSQLSDTMIDYCKQDVDVTLRVYNHYKKYIWDPTWSKALRLEHDTAITCSDMQRNGFAFDRDGAAELLDSVTQRMAELEELFQTQWPPQLEEVNRIKYRVRADGNLFANVELSMSSYPKTQVEGGDLVCYDYIPFNPGSPAQRVRKLWEANWSPTEKTKTHYKFSKQAEVGKKWGTVRLTQQLYDEKKEHFDYYGWTVSEENLLTLPDDAPQAAKSLAEWLTLEGRRSSLVEWIGQCKPDGRIHGKFWHIGAWTHRMSHSAPNSANISSAFHGTPSNAVEEVKATYDGRLRALWRADPEAYLVGSDAEGIQLRILAHYLKSDDYVHAIVNGRKEDESDIHNVNRKALGLAHITRDDSKTFIYAHILGAGLQKTARILRATQQQTKKAVEEFQSKLGLDVLRRGLISRDARRGYFDGLDSRRVLCNSEHLMLAGYLQNGEALVMKWATRLWTDWAREEKINFKLVNFVHDEWQTECYGSMDQAERLGELQRNAIVQAGLDLGVYCPLAGSTDIGKTWYDTH